MASLWIFFFMPLVLLPAALIKGIGIKWRANWLLVVYRDSIPATSFINVGGSLVLGVGII